MDLLHVSHVHTSDTCSGYNLINNLDVLWGACVNAVCERCVRGQLQRVLFPRGARQDEASFTDFLDM